MSPDARAGWPEPDVVESAARTACTELVARFYEFVDEGRSSQASPLFASDAEMVVNGNVLDGDQIRELLIRREADASRRTAHVGTVGTFRMLGDDRAELRSFLLHYVLGDGAPNGAPSSLNAVRDVFRRSEDGSWQIERRELTLLAGNGG